jgi:glycerol kinase
MRIASAHGLSSTIAWSKGDRVSYALEGNISVSGQAAAFATQLFGWSDERTLTELAASVDDSEGVVFVPALAGLGAPHWDDQARGLACGMSLRTRPAHVARAVLEGIAHQICDVFEAMEADLGEQLNGLSVDGGASNNDLLMQLLADLLGRAVVRPAITVASALGAAAMAGEAVGQWAQSPIREAGEFTPRMDETKRARLRNSWRDAVARARLPGSG